MHLSNIYEGEIIDVSEQKSDSTVPFVRYKCLVHLGDGSQIMTSNVEVATMFGGIGDFFQHRARTSADTNTKLSFTTQQNENSRTGDRVLIAFLGGSIQRPMIIGYHQHPKQTPEITGSDAKSLKPNAIFQYLGVRITIDETGQLKIIHKGAPEVKYTGSDSGGLSAITSLAPTIPGLGVDNPALTPKEETETTIIELLDEGIFRVRDEEGQIFELDRTKKTITISNNGLSSTADELSATGALSADDNESLVLNKEDKTATLRARDGLVLTSDGIRTDTVSKDFETKVDGELKTEVAKDYSESIAGSYSGEISKSYEAKVGKDWTIEINGNATLSASGAILKLGKGKVGLGSSSAEVVDSIVQILNLIAEAMKALATETHLGNLGYPSGPPLNAAQYSAIDAKVAALTQLVTSIKGGV